MSLLSVKQIEEFKLRAEAEASRRLETFQMGFRHEYPGCDGARMDFSPNPPDPPNTAAITRDTLQAQVDLLPKQLAAEQAYRPGFNQVNLESILQILKGMPGGTKTITGTDFDVKPAGWYDQSGRFVSAQKNYGGPAKTVYSGGHPYTTGGVGGLTWYDERKLPVTRTQTIETEGTPGLLSLYENDIIPLVNRMQRDATTQQREADVADVEKYGSRYREALRDANPEQSALRDKLYAEGMEELNNKGLSAFESQRFAQNYRAANQGRLGDTGASGAGAEAFYLADRERARMNEKRAFAQGLISLDQALYGDPVMQVLGRQSGISPLSAQLFQSGAGTASMPSATLTDPFNALPWQTANNWMGLKTQANIAGAQNDADIYGGMLKSGVSGIMGGLTSMI